MKSVNKLTDEELVRLVRSQDQELYRELVRRYQNKLMRYATYLIRDQNQAADAVQEAFIKAFVNLKSFNVKKKFSSWIYRIVHNETINQAKKHRPEISLDGNHWIQETVSNSVNLEADFEKQEIKQMIHSCLNRLPLKYRSPLTLYYLEDQSYQEISDVLRMPVGTVGTRINRAKKLLLTICRAKEVKQNA